MSSIFSKYKDNLLDFAESRDKGMLKYPLKKTGNMLNNYTRGDFIVIGGRKTSGKSSFILHNYVISPLIQKLQASKENTPCDVKVMYLNTRKNVKTTLERMIVNFSSQKNGGNKIGVPTLYGLDGPHKKLSVEKCKSIIGTSMNTFNTLSEKGFLNVISAKKSIYEIDSIIRSSMEEYGTLDESTGEFTYNDSHKDMLAIVAVDDVTGIYAEAGSSNIRNDNSHLIAGKLKELAKIYNFVLVLAVPSASTYSKTSYHSSSLEEVAPYGIYADRVIILHNPAETEEKHMLGYNVPSFINSRTGVCYLRTAFIAANYMGPSNLSVGFMMYPENGYIIELPASDDIEELDNYLEIVNE